MVSPPEDFWPTSGCQGVQVESGHWSAILRAVEKMLCDVQSFSNGNVHVQIAIGTKPAQKGNAVLPSRELDVLLQNRPFLNESNRIIGNLARFVASTVFTKADG